MLNKNACRAVVEKNADGILVVDRKGVVRFANPAAQTLFGRGEAGLLDQNLGCPLVAGETTELDLVLPSRAHRVVELRATEIEWEDGKMAFLVALRDVTVRQELMDRLNDALAVAETALSAKNRFLSNMSHELRTPLNAVIGFSDLLLSGTMGPLNVTQEEFLRDVLLSGRQLLCKINDILSLADLESGRRSCDQALLQLQPFFDNTLSPLRDEAREKGVRFSVDLQDAPSHFVSDGRLLSRILLQLARNAIRHTPPGGEIQLRVEGIDEPSDRRLRLTLSDTGDGLVPDDAQRIFQPFEQVDGSSSRANQGIGVGLTLARKSAELLGGRLWAESPGPRQGCVLLLELPWIAKDASLPLPEEPA
ncbi:MAG: HAMP domain-containing histidine kinase [Magnetococcales bacterium]|nr:HAMP domain-containing histidine kinase [Magnetococcales bacterium]